MPPEASLRREPQYLSHYYRFKSLEMLKKLTWDAGKRELLKVARSPPPKVFTLAPASPTGYGRRAPPGVA